MTIHNVSELPRKKLQTSSQICNPENPDKNDLAFSQFQRILLTYCWKKSSSTATYCLSLSLLIGL